MTIKKVMHDIWLVLNDKDKYVGMIRDIGANFYAAFKDGQLLGTSTSLEGAEKYFEN